MLAKIIQFIKDSWLIILVTIVISILTLSISGGYYHIGFLDRAFQSNSKLITIDAFHAIEITILTFILIIVAWVQLKSLNNTGNADFLLRLDESFASDQILKARNFLHRLYIKCKPHCDHEPSMTCDCHEKHMQAMRDYIKSIRHDPDFSTRFIQLRNLLELFETFGFFSQKGYVNKNDVNKLVGGTIEFHYEIFKDWIHYLQDNKDPTSFQAFERLVYDFKPSLVPENRRYIYNEKNNNCKIF